jgi:hypothetical protein
MVKLGRGIAAHRTHCGGHASAVTVIRTPGVSVA